MAEIGGAGTPNLNKSIILLSFDVRIVSGTCRHHWTNSSLSLSYWMTRFSDSLIRMYNARYVVNGTMTARALCNFNDMWMCLTQVHLLLIKAFISWLNDWKYVHKIIISINLNKRLQLILVTASQAIMLVHMYQSDQNFQNICLLLTLEFLPWRSVYSTSSSRASRGWRIYSIVLEKYCKKRKRPVVFILLKIERYRYLSTKIAVQLLFP